MIIYSFCVRRWFCRGLIAKVSLTSPVWSHLFTLFLSFSENLSYFHLQSRASWSVIAKVLCLDWTSFFVDFDPMSVLFLLLMCFFFLVAFFKVGIHGADLGGRLMIGRGVTGLSLEFMIKWRRFRGDRYTWGMLRYCEAFLMMRAVAWTGKFASCWFLQRSNAGQTYRSFV